MLQAGTLSRGLTRVWCLRAKEKFFKKRERAHLKVLVDVDFPPKTFLLACLQCSDYNYWEELVQVRNTPSPLFSPFCAVVSVTPYPSSPSWFLPLLGPFPFAKAPGSSFPLQSFSPSPFPTPLSLSISCSFVLLKNIFLLSLCLSSILLTTSLLKLQGLTDFT